MRLLSRLSPRSRKIFDWVTGVTLIVLGILGLFLPILQGIVLILAGLAVLSSHNRHARELNDRLRSFGAGVKQRVVDTRDAHRRRRDERRRARAASEPPRRPRGEATRE